MVLSKAAPAAAVAALGLVGLVALASWEGGAPGRRLRGLGDAGNSSEELPVLGLARRECREWAEQCGPTYTCGSRGCGTWDVCESVCRSWGLVQDKPLENKTLEAGGSALVLPIVELSRRECRDYFDECQETYSCSARGCGPEMVCERKCRNWDILEVPGLAMSSPAKPLPANATVTTLNRECREWAKSCKDEYACSAAGSCGVERVCRQVCRDSALVLAKGTAGSLAAAAAPAGVAPPASKETPIVNFNRDCQQWGERCQDQYTCSATACGIGRVCEPVCNRWSLLQVSGPGAEDAANATKALAVDEPQRRHCRQWFTKCSDEYSCAAKACGVTQVCEDACRNWGLLRAAEVTASGVGAVEAPVVSLTERECRDWTTSCEKKYSCGARACGIEQVCEQVCKTWSLVQVSADPADNKQQSPP